MQILHGNFIWFYSDSDAARKRNHRLDETLIIFTHTRNLFPKQTVSNARIYNKCMLYEMHAHMASVQVYVVQTRLCPVSTQGLKLNYINFLKSKFTYFMGKVQVKIIQTFSSYWWCIVTATSAIVKSCRRTVYHSPIVCQIQSSYDLLITSVCLFSHR